MATPKHTPEARGYMSSLNYWSHKNDFWSMVSDKSGCSGPDVIDLWQANTSAAGVAWHLVGAGYEKYLFRDEALRLLEADPAFCPAAPVLRGVRRSLPASGAAGGLREDAARSQRGRRHQLRWLDRCGLAGLRERAPTSPTRAAASTTRWSNCWTVWSKRSTCSSWPSACGTTPSWSSRPTMAGRPSGRTPQGQHAVEGR